MLFDDENDSKKRKGPGALDTLSVPELKEYLARLKEEALRVESELQKKEKYKSALEGLFKTPE